MSATTLRADFFSANQPLYVSRAPGRLDVMGGISDYSGGLCLEWPLDCATRCALQRTNDGLLTVFSGNAAAEGWAPQVTVSSAEIIDAANGTAPAHPPEERWANYVLGAFAILLRHDLLKLDVAEGARLEVASDVPLGAGVSSSASIEVAVMAAVAAAFSIQLSGIEIAHLCQEVENRWVGAPCGIMDQLTVALGEAGSLLRLLCQPDIVEGYEQLPEGVLLFGIDSHVKHSVGGSAYGKARCAAFMGRRILHDIVPQAMQGPDGREHLANISTDVWRALRGQIPESITGADFLQQYGGHGDTATIVQPNEAYPVRLATEHPIYEADRVRRFAALLEAVRHNPAARQPLLAAAGDLMVQSHFSYDHRCNLGSAETDLLVDLARQRGPAAGIYGAKITGGGAGGTVAILADGQAGDVEVTVREIMAEYQQQTGNLPHLFSGSSDGAVAHGVREMSANDFINAN